MGDTTPQGSASAWLAAELARHRKAAAATLGIVTLGVGGLYLRRLLKRNEIRRPYELRDLSGGQSVEDPQAELTQVIEWLQDAIVRPIDARLPGHPFEYDLLAFPFTPMVLLVGNHSAGKSTFINSLLGVQTQETGVAPTDDGFTVLQRCEGVDQIEDGPTLLGCGENKPYKDLKRFGQAFWGHLKRKRLALNEDATMPYGLQVVDTPGMIDMPQKIIGGSDSYHGGRGYNFIEVVRWFGKRADLILLLFDPDKPGTTGESLDVLTKSLAGLDHKFLIVLNKVDRLDSSLDFARAYGTLGWALSKVIPRKDIPQIYTTYNDFAGATEASDKAHKLPLETFRKKREEVIAEVLRAKTRHWDNVITSTEDTLRQVEMVSTITTAVRNVVARRTLEVQLVGSVALVVPGLVGSNLLYSRWTGSSWGIAGCVASYCYVCYTAISFLRDYLHQFSDLQVANLDVFFEQSYRSHFIHSDGEDLRARWASTRPRISAILNAVYSAATLPAISSWEIRRLNDVIENDVWYLRQLAKLLRVPEAPPGNLESF